MNVRKLVRWSFLAVCMLMAAPAAADIWGFVDENGVAHLSNTRVDDRYFLFRKQVQRVAPPADAGTTEDMAMQRAVSSELAGAAAARVVAPLIEQVSKEHAVDAGLIYAVVAAESNFNANAQSPKGARGLMQLMPDTAQRFGVTDVWNPLQNLRGGARYLRYLLTFFQDNVSLALAAYNAGEGAVVAAGYEIPPFAETRSYVPKVLRLWERTRGEVRSPH
jgi:soluble lytic murein transglycosylase-like protein